MTKHASRGLTALAFGTFALGAAEFVMMGVLPQSAASMGVSIPTAGHFISAYAIGVCVGTLFLVFGRRIPPRTLLLAFAALIAIGNLMAACSASYVMLLAARFISGLPHGAFFGVAAIVAKALAQPGREASAVSIPLTGQTIANMLGVPLGTMVGEFLSWRIAFAFLGVWAIGALVVMRLWVPRLPAIHDAGLLGQFRFLTKPGPWMIVGAVLLGNTGIFCWWSYVSPWLTTVGGFPSGATPLLMALAGFGMVVGGICGGRLGDRWRNGGSSAVGQSISCLGLVLVMLAPGSMPLAAALTFLCSFSMFFVNAPQQLLMVDVGEGGGEMIGSALVQIGFNLGNSIGAAIGGMTLNATAMNYRLSSGAGIPFTCIAALLLAAFAWRYELRAPRNPR
ncbi:MFS transporter [Bifidobacterium margollesii]|uniref:MFS transporter n=1 Tax=Bifidobacterium margollesii TaxID=2020964 RepID=A0A2N5JB37_9BIFI|nr:MFS transporter [Bifidobacterium margollesii]PLS31420.1 MFS transporter [Bifidobacterium margollesii]